MAKLVIVEGDDRGTVFRLMSDRTVVGRSVAAQVRIDDTEASRQHAEIVKREDGAYVVRDLGSRNGTLVNGEKIEGEEGRLLSGGERIRIGRTVLQFQIAASALSLPEKEPAEVPPERAGASTVASVRAKAAGESADAVVVGSALVKAARQGGLAEPVSYTHLTLPTN